MIDRAGTTPAVPALRIGLLWHSLASGNLGVGALTLANMAIARDVAARMGFRPEFVVLGMRDTGPALAVPADVSAVAIDTRALLSPAGYLARIGQLDCILDIGAGDSFADIYGAKRFGFLWLSKMLPALRGVPVLLSPQTIGPFTKPLYRRLAAIALGRARAVVARDEQSLAVAKALAPQTPARLSVDVAFELPFVNQSERRGGPVRRIGINASGLLFSEALSGRNRFGLSVDYARFTRDLIGALLARGDCEVHLIAHATSAGDPGDDDGHRADALAAEFPGTIRVPDFAGPSEAKSYISGLDLLVAGRMHACIGAFSSGTPVVPVAYSRKFSGLFGLLGYEAMIPVTGMTTDAATAFVLDAIERRDALAAAEQAGMARVAGLLDAYRELLAALFTEVAGKRR